MEVSRLLVRGSRTHEESDASVESTPVAPADTKQANYKTLASRCKPKTRRAFGRRPGNGAGGDGKRKTPPVGGALRGILDLRPRGSGSVVWI